MKRSVEGEVSDGEHWFTHSVLGMQVCGDTVVIEMVVVIFVQPTLCS